MAKATFKVMYNQDCTNLFGTIKEPLEPRHVEHMVDEVADGGADVMLINPNAQRVNYPSKVWQTFWDGYAPGKREFFGPVPEDQVPGREHWVGQMKRLADQRCDYMKCALARCRARGIHPGVTIRMNDMHDVPWPGSNLFSRFYMEHPQLRLKNPPIGGWSKEGLNYEHAEVREHYLSLIRELVEDYDFDALELDFLRFHCYFPRDDFERHCDIMTGFVREVRAILGKAPRPIALIPRIATNPAAAYELGFDVGTWARQDIVDGITTGAFLNTAWNIPIDAFRKVVGNEVAIYACTDSRADIRDGLPARALQLDERLLRGFAAGYLAAGADGICFFNFFCSREETDPHDPLFHVIRDLRSRQSLRGKPRTHIITAGVSVAEADGPMQVPARVGAADTRAFQMWLAAEKRDARVEIDLVVEASAAPSAQTLWLSLNTTTLGTAREIREGPPGSKRVQTATFAAPATALRDGLNVLVFRNEGPPLTVLGVDVRVDP